MSPLAERYCVLRSPRARAFSFMSMRKRSPVPPAASASATAVSFAETSSKPWQSFHADALSGLRGLPIRDSSRLARHHDDVVGPRCSIATSAVMIFVVDAIGRRICSRFALRTRPVSASMTIAAGALILDLPRGARWRRYL